MTSSRHDEYMRASAMSHSDPEDLPEHPRAAWGECNEDYPDSDDITCSTIEETEQFYDRPDIRIIDQE